MSVFSHIGMFFRSFTRPFPARDWFVALVLAFFIFFAFSAYGVYLYVAIDSGAVFDNRNASSAEVIPVKTGDLNDVLSTYRTRSAAWTAHALPEPPVSDPR
jgi:hypothetical protein